MAIGMILTAFQGDAAGLVVEREPNEIVLAGYFIENGITLPSSLPPSQITVSPMTPGAAKNAVVVAVLPQTVSGSYRVRIGQQSGGGAPWPTGVHLFAVIVTALGPGGAVSQGVTLATAFICHPEQVPPPENPDPNQVMV